ncbi:MAG: HlyD family efflux transporter periplasmic adaptor subunit [Terracidiphilus sp.]|jgi:putative peptide zinc metalloprotease protein
MNLSEALDAALPEIPRTRLEQTRPALLDPGLITREDTLDGEPVIAVMQRQGSTFCRLTPVQWQLAQFFDGQRSFEDIAEAFQVQTGMATTAAEVRAFADGLEEVRFFYKSPQEKNLALSQKLAAQRQRRAGRNIKFDVAHITFSAWDPDRYLTWLNEKAGRIIYSRWSILAMVLLFAYEASIFVTKWNLIGPDVAVFYNFREKSLLDVVQFWLLLLVIGFFHESAHGLTCKHFGGQVHAMGLLFLYLTPAFYVDVTEVWISATTAQRLATIIAGIWIEMVMCGFAMIAWLNTAPATWLHDLAYQVILITGIAVIVINMNPLIKADGYYFVTEAIGIPTLKERSTEFLSGWFQKQILRLPVETVVIPRRRAPFFALYALVSGAYSYMILFVVLRFGYNVASKWIAEFAIVPVGIAGFFIFRSRLKSLSGVVRRFCEQHFAQDRLLRPVPLISALILAAILFIPIWRDREDAWYEIEATNPEVLHASLAGRVDEVMVRDGDMVRAGQPLLRMSSPAGSAMRDAAAAENSRARFQVVDAELRGASAGTAVAAQDAARKAISLAGEARSSLLIKAPMDGIVLTNDPESLVGQNIGPGEPLLDLAGAGNRSVRVYIPAAALDRIPQDAEVALPLPGRFTVVRMRLASPGGEAFALPPGLVSAEKYKGTQTPLFYCALMQLPSSACEAPLGIAGEAKIFGKRHSLAARAIRLVSDLARSHLW